MTPPLVSVSVDLDAVECYHRIHALGDGPSGEARFAILRRALPRLGELFARHGIAATLFTVGRDLEEDAEGTRIVADLAKAGHEIASHSYSHPYDLVRLGRDRITAEIDRAHAAIAEACGVAPVGFRAPGYEISAELVDVLCQRGYRYDSSAFPAIPYYLAKAAVMAGLRLAGRKSGSILGSPRVLAAPCVPYRPAAGAPYRPGNLPIIEMPVTVTPLLRLHVIGTTIVIAPEWLRSAAGGVGPDHPAFQSGAARHRPRRCVDGWNLAGAGGAAARSSRTARAQARGARRNVVRGTQRRRDLHDPRQGR